MCEFATASAHAPLEPFGLIDASTVNAEDCGLVNGSVMCPFKPREAAADWSAESEAELSVYLKSYSAKTESGMFAFSLKFANVAETSAL